MDNNLANNSSLNPNAAEFQPFIPQSPIINNSYQYIPQMNQNTANIQNQQTETNNYIPKLQLQIRAAMAALDSNNVISIEPNKSTKSSDLKIPPIIAIDDTKDKTIFYNTLDITVPQKGNAYTKNIKSETYQGSNDDNLLIVGYCRDNAGIQIHMIPIDLFVLFIQFYGTQNGITLIGFASHKAGFGVGKYGTKKTVYYIPQSKNSKSMNTIICTANNIKIPFHIINEYNIKYATNHENKINKFDRFNVLFLQNMFPSMECSAIAFNDQCAFELILPQCLMFKHCSYKTKPSIYCLKYGLLVSMRGALISFSLKTWQWTVIERNEKFGDAGMCLLEKESKLFVYRWNHGHMHNEQKKRDYYFYDLTTSTFENMPNSDHLCPKPAFCCDETVNGRIYALSRFDKYRGSFAYFDLNTFEWIHDTLPKNKKGMNQIWIGDDKNILYGACNNRGVRCVFMLDLRVPKQWNRVHLSKSFRPFKGSHCQKFFKL